MTTATFDGKPLREIEEPAAIATKLINVLAPMVQEIARRSGAPGELVLRRDLGEGRREEIYITKAELQREGADAAGDAAAGVRSVRAVRGSALARARPRRRSRSIIDAE